MLEVKSLTAGYTGTAVLREVSLTVEPGTVVTVLGVNGSGKSTLLRAISGLVPTMGGEVSVDGLVVKGMKPHEMARLGVAHCLEGRRVFPFMTVLENLLLAGYGRKRSTRKSLERVFGLFPVLEQRKAVAAGKLSGGERQMLCIAQTLVVDYRYILLDEITGGLSPLLCKEMGQVVRELSSDGAGILWAEQNAQIALGWSDSCVVLQLGEVLLRGISKDLVAHEVVRRDYLGFRTTELE